MLCVIDHAAYQVEENFDVLQWLRLNGISFYNSHWQTAEVPVGTSVVVISGGPLHSSAVPKTTQLIKEFSGTRFGICLGCMCIVEAFGGSLVDCEEQKAPMLIDSVADPIFATMPPQFEVMTAHRQKIQTVPDCLKVIATAVDGQVMAVRHRTLPVYGFMFHPESPKYPAAQPTLKNCLARTCS